MNLMTDQISAEICFMPFFFWFIFSCFCFLLILPIISSVVQEVMKIQSVQHLLEPVLEPLIRRVVWFNVISNLFMIKN